MFFTILTVVGLGLITVVSFVLLDKEVLSPGFIFPLVFFFACLNGLLNYVAWSYDLRPLTAAVILGSCALFSGVSVAVHRWRCVARHKGLPRVEPACELYVPVIVQIVFIVFQLVVYALTIKAILDVSHASGFDGSVLETISYYSDYSKHSVSVDLSLPLTISTGTNICQALGLVQAYILANNVVSRMRFARRDALGIVNMLLAIAGSMVGGSRSVAMLMLMAIVVMAFIMFSQSPAADKVSKAKTLGILAGIVVIGTIIFFSVYLLRGGDFAGLYSHFSIYFGAPVKNLDLYLGEPWAAPGIFGENTFINLYTSLRKVVPALIPPAYVLDNPYRKINGYDLGNVHTTLYAPIHDFGFAGLIVLVAIMACIMQFLYEECWLHHEASPRHMARSRAGGISAALGARLEGIRRPLAYCLYGYLFHSVALAFFSNKFYETLFRLGFIEFVCIWIIVFLVLGSRTVPVDDEAVRTDERDNFQA